MYERCETCRYWAQRPGHADIGGCRRYPPAALPDGVNLFPATWHKSWCGEWRERERDPMDVSQR